LIFFNFADHQYIKVHCVASGILSERGENVSKRKHEKEEESSAVPNHMHCFGCGRSMPYKETGDPFCSDECKTSYEKTTGKRRRVLLVCLALPLAVVIMLIVARALHFI